MERLGIGTIPGVGWPARQVEEVAREAEASGLDAIFVAEVNNDALATAQLMGSATQTIGVGTWVANIYLRHPYVCAQHAALIGDATEGRFILGLGVSHSPVNDPLGVEMKDPRSAVVDYATAVQGHLRGEGPPTHVPQRPAPVPVPVYLAALTSTTVETAAGIADGLMPLFWSAERVARSKSWIERGRAKAASRESLDLALGIPTYIGSDLDAMRDAARANLALFTTFPFFQHLFRVSGYAAEAARMVDGAGGAALSDRLLDAVCLIGPIERCREQLEAFRAAGVDLPILVPGIGVDAARDVIRAFAR
jgi:alkanesulfonate monooxygenase SsuD/methylene tetrahydromethanopterin reductase-like flavin-dependent oxidoreductase (luciferase family)